MGEFPPPPPFFFLNHADAQTSNTSSRLWFYYIITKNSPPNPRLPQSAFYPRSAVCSLRFTLTDFEVFVAAESFQSRSKAILTIRKVLFAYFSLSEYRNRIFELNS